MIVMDDYGNENIFVMTRVDEGIHYSAARWERERITKFC